MWRRVFLVVFIGLSAEVGVLLLLLPWTEFWTRNAFFGPASGLRDLLLSDYFRGAVSGLGVVNLLVAFGEARHFSERLRELDL
jgi:hypothetical protein